MDCEINGIETIGSGWCVTHRRGCYQICPEAFFVMEQAHQELVAAAKAVGVMFLHDRYLSTSQLSALRDLEVAVQKVEDANGQ